MIRHTVAALALAGALIATPNATQARTKLVTLPERAKLIVNLEHPWRSILAEEREITLQKGENQIDFSWQGVSIDPGSIRLTVLSHPGEGPEATKIISVAFPPNEAALTWQIYSPEARTERVRVSYLLNGISRGTSYEMTVDQAETKALFRQFFQLVNQSGENLGDAAFRIGPTEDLTRSVESGESRRFLSAQKDALPINKIFVSRPSPNSTRGEDGEIISMVYEISNTTEAGMGTFKLDAGKARIYADDGTGSTIFVGEDMLEEIAPKEKKELGLGTVKDVVLKRRIMSDKRDPVKVNKHRNPVLWDRKVHLKYEIENFKDKDATVRVIEMVPPDAQFETPSETGVTFVRKSATELEITISLKARPKGEGEEVKSQDINIKYTVANMTG